jgi:hypothetical protein
MHVFVAFVPLLLQNCPAWQLAFVTQVTAESVDSQPAEVHALLSVSVQAVLSPA